MRRIRLLVVLTTGLFTLATAVSASAATPVGPPAPVPVQGGSLSIPVPAAGGNLQSGPNAVGGMTLSGTLGQVQVTDARSAAAGSGWGPSAIATAFTPP